MFSIGYAAPETIQQLEAGKATITASPAVDMWALGVIAFELLTGGPIFAHGDSRADAMAKLAGRAALPWEAGAAGRDEKLAKLRRLRGTILACLDRDPAARPTAQGLVNTWERFWDAVDTGSPQEAAAKDAEAAGGAVDAGAACRVRPLDETAPAQ
jgi:serine/threonine protein kinase